MHFETLLFTQDHEWLKVDGENGTIGITQFAQEELGDIVYINIFDQKEFKKGDIFGNIDSVKTFSDLYAPVDMEITNVNSELETSPELINKEPYGKGWIIEIKILGDTEDMLDHAAYKDLIS